jgi:hypothetical protein
MTISLQTGARKRKGEPHMRRAVFGKSPGILPPIFRNDVHMAVWQRQIASTLISKSELLAARGLINHQMTVSVAKLGCLQERLSFLEPYPRLKEDIQLLTEMFSCLFDPKYIGLRLTTLTEAMCPRFHVDKVSCRLITTYVGAGTEWLPYHDVDRSKLGAGCGGRADADSGLYPSAQCIQTLTSGDVALLKGESWESNEGAGLVHRSPAVEPAQQRLLLTLDSIS